MDCPDCSPGYSCVPNSISPWTLILLGNFSKKIIGSAQADPTVIPRLRGNHSDHPPSGAAGPATLTPSLQAHFLGTICPIFVCKVAQNAPFEGLA